MAAASAARGAHVAGVIEAVDKGQRVALREADGGDGDADHPEPGEDEAAQQVAALAVVVLQQAAVGAVPAGAAALVLGHVPGVTPGGRRRRGRRLRGGRGGRHARARACSRRVRAVQAFEVRLRLRWRGGGGSGGEVVGARHHRAILRVTAPANAAGRGSACAGADVARAAAHGRSEGAARRAAAAAPARPVAREAGALHARRLSLAFAQTCRGSDRAALSSRRARSAQRNSDARNAHRLRAKW